MTVKHLSRLFLGLLFGLSACQAPQAPTKEVTLPEWIIPEAKMTDILTDVHVLEGARIGKKMIGDSLYTIDHYNKLWEKHQVTEALYDSSFRFYCQHAERMDRMYEEVLTRLSKMSSNVSAQGGEDDEEEVF